MVAGELVHENDGSAGAGLFVMQANAVVGRCKGHDVSPRGSMI